MLLEEETTRAVIGAAVEVHRALGPGLQESAYEECLAHELTTRGIPFQRQVALPVRYKATKLDCGHRMNFVIADKVILEIRSVDGLRPLHEAQLLTYLRLSGRRVGLIMNFNAIILKDGIIRRVL